MRVGSEYENSEGEGELSSSSEAEGPRVEKSGRDCVEKRLVG